MGVWLDPAKQLVEQHGDQLAARPSWIFSSGPTGDPPRPAADKAVQIDSLTTGIRPREHRLFAGRLDKSTLSFAKRAVVLAVRGAEGDFRDWDEIKTWARGIAKLCARPADGHHGAREGLLRQRDDLRA
jgi:menaquinone-dependent protoporphyrinogen oxidase